MKNFFRTLLHWIAQVAASEAGEFLSVRRKAHLLEAERYRRLADEAAKKRPAAAPMLSVTRVLRPGTPTAPADRRPAPRHRPGASPPGAGGRL